MKAAFVKLVVLFAALSASTATAAGIRVVAQVDTSQDIYVGEAFIYSIIIDGDNQPGQVDMAALAAFKPRSAGNRDMSSVITQIINGTSSRQITKRLAMNYALTVNRAGPVVIGAVSVTVAGKVYKTQPVRVNVVTPGTTDKLKVELSLSTNRCYVGQPVELSVKFYFGQDVRNPHFAVDVLGNDAFTFENPDKLAGQEQEFDIGAATTLVGRQYPTVVGGQNYQLVSLRKVMIPKRAGHFDIPPVRVSTDMAVGRTRDTDGFGFFTSRLQYKRFAVSSKAASLDVQPLPEDGKPDSFYGLVGKYSIETEASPVEVSVGDPITLTIRVKGDFLGQVQTPALDGVPELAKNFKVPAQMASPTVGGGQKVFTQTIRANNDKVKEIPSIPLAYFDTELGKYVVSHSDPIALKVAPTKVLTRADLEGKEPVTVNKEVEAVKRGLSANYEDPDCLTDQSFSVPVAVVSPGYAVVWALPLLALMGSVIGRSVLYASPQKKAAAVRRRALGRAAKAVGAVIERPEGERPALVVEAMRQYIGERFAKVVGSLTAEDCYRTIIEETGDEQVAVRYRNVVAEYEAARYAASGVGVDKARTDEVVDLLKAVEKKARK